MGGDNIGNEDVEGGGGGRKLKRGRRWWLKGKTRDERSMYTLDNDERSNKNFFFSTIS